jgi:predicted Zn-dependent protease
MYLESIRISDQQKDFLSILGYTYLKNNKLGNATTVYQALFYLFPKSDYFSFCLSYLYLKQKQYEKALYYINIYFVNTTNPNRLSHLIKSQSLFHIGRRKEAKECAKAFFQPRQG